MLLWSLQASFHHQLRTVPQGKGCGGAYEYLGIRMSHRYSRRPRKLASQISSQKRLLLSHDSSGRSSMCVCSIGHFDMQTCIHFDSWRWILQSQLCPSSDFRTNQGFQLWLEMHRCSSAGLDFPILAAQVWVQEPLFPHLSAAAIQRLQGRASLTSSARRLILTLTWQRLQSQACHSTGRPRSHSPGARWCAPSLETVDSQSLWPPLQSWLSSHARWWL